MHARTAQAFRQAGIGHVKSRAALDALVETNPANRIHYSSGWAQFALGDHTSRVVRFRIIFGRGIGSRCGGWYLFLFSEFKRVERLWNSVLPDFTRIAQRLSPNVRCEPNFAHVAPLPVVRGSIIEYGFLMAILPKVTLWAHETIALSSVRLDTTLWALNARFLPAVWLEWPAQAHAARYRGVSYFALVAFGA
jgi:hypothetical protein